MAKLKFEMDAGGKLTKTALGMFSKEDEYVEFNASCDCTGQVQPALALFTHNALQKDSLCSAAYRLQKAF